MGRWSSTYYDEVLGSKLKSLVCGAIERAKLEKEDPPVPAITYENFVQDLDHGDSFTTFIIDILVKELAERKTRPSSTDRHLIAERTAKSLRNLGRIHTFPNRSASRRPFANEFFVSHNGASTALDWDVLTQSADDNELDIDDEAVRGWGSVARDAAEQTFHPFPEAGASATTTTTRRSFPVQTATEPGTDDDMPPLGFPSRRSPPAHVLARHTSLARQPSIRRPARSRTNDFSEFTSRRRTSGRHEQAARPGDSSSSMDIANLLHTHHNAMADQATDGVLPVAFATPPGAGPFGRRMTRVRSADEREYVESPRFTPFTLHSTGSPTGAAPSSSRMHAGAPRLRRGGVRAPEQYAASDAPPLPPREDEMRLPLPRRSSSAEMEYIIQTASQRFGSRSPRSGSPISWTATASAENWNTSGPAGPSNGAAARQQSGTPTNLPTPRSISPENN